MKSKKIEKEKRKQINFRLNDEEFEWLDYQIKKYKIPMTISAFAKYQAVNGYVNCLGIAESDVKIITTSLARISNNLNQITKLYHQNKLPHHISAINILDDVAKLKNLLIDLLKVKNNKKTLTKSKKKSKIFCDLLEQNGIDRSVGYNIYFLRAEVLAKKISQNEKIMLLNEELKNKNISLELATKVEKIIISIEQKFNEKESHNGIRQSKI